MSHKTLVGRDGLAQIFKDKSLQTKCVTAIGYLVRNLTFLNPLIPVLWLIAILYKDQTTDELICLKIPKRNIRRLKWKERPPHKIQ